MDSMRQLGTSTTNSMSVGIERLGAAGVRATIITFATFNNETRRDQDRWEDQTERTFSVSALLAKHYNVMTDVKGDFSANDGTSYLSAPPSTSALKCSIPGGEFLISKNLANELSMIAMEILAVNPNDARDKFQGLIYP